MSNLARSVVAVTANCAESFLFRPGTNPSVDLHPSRTLVSATMSIRFQCGSCSQPIEVDDEWASKPVACPYCRKTVTAPIESTLGDPAAFQAAVPVATGPPAAQPFSTTPDAAQQAAGRNRLAVVSLALAIAAIGMFVASGLVSAGHSEQLQELQDAYAGASDYAEQVKIMNELLKADPDAMRWLLPLAVLSIGWLVTNLAAIVCGIIGVRRPARRGMAIAALAISFLPILMIL